MGLTDFAKGVAGAVGGFAEDVGGGVADVAQDFGGAAVNISKGVGYVANPTHWDDIGEGVSKTASFIADHPGQAWDTGFEVGRYMLKEELKPQNIAMNVALLAAGVGIPALAAKVGVGAKTATTAVKGAKAVEEVAEASKVASRAERFGQGASRALSKVDEVLSKPQQWQSAALEHIPGGGRVAQFAEWRGDKAQEVMGWAGDSKAREMLAKPLARRVAGGDLAASEAVGGGRVATASWRYNKVSSLDPRNLRENVQVAGDVTQAIAHPERAARELGQAAWHEYGDEATRMAMTYAPGLVKKAFGGGGGKKERGGRAAPQAATPQQIGLMDFHLDRTHATRTSRRQPGGPAVLGTVTAGAMPSQIGPSDWYGPQQAYSSGRGFQSPQSELPPLEQPGAYSPSDETLGV